jgi:hypothetical protein
MSLFHATTAGLVATLGGSLYLAVFTNPLTGLLTFLTSVVYLAAYTPLKRVSPICTFVGAFPGAMPGVLGWTAARGQLEWGTLILFAILFVWQFPHFFSIAWLYREDYAQGGIRMLPVVEEDGRSTARRIVVYSLILIPLSVLPSVFGMAGKIYMVGAIVLGIALFYFGARLAFLKLPLNSPAIENVRSSRLASDGHLSAPAFCSYDEQLAEALKWFGKRDSGVCSQQISLKVMAQNTPSSIPRAQNFSRNMGGFSGRRLTRAESLRRLPLTEWHYRLARTRCRRSTRSAGPCPPR